MGFTRPRYARALDQLIEVGFIDINHRGGGMEGDSSTYFISDRWKNFGTESFKPVKRVKDKRGIGFKSYWEGEKSKTSNENVTGASNENVTGLQISSNENVTGIKRRKIPKPIKILEKRKNV